MAHPTSSDSDDLVLSAPERLTGLEPSSSLRSRLVSTYVTDMDMGAPTLDIQINEPQPQSQRSELIGYQYPHPHSISHTSKHSKTIPSMNTSSISTSTSTSLLHSQQIQVQVPGSSSSSAEIQHNPRAESCLCSTCHLSSKLFPRTEDGRIVLPTPPWVSIPIPHHQLQLQLQQRQQGMVMVDGSREQEQGLYAHDYYDHEQRIYYRNQPVSKDMDTLAMFPPDFFHTPNENDQLQGVSTNPALVGPGVSGNTITTGSRTSTPTPVSSQIALPHLRHHHHHHHPQSQIENPPHPHHPHQYTTSYLGPVLPPHPQAKPHSISISERMVNAPNLYSRTGTSSSLGIGSADGSPPILVNVPGSSCQEGSSTISTGSKRVPMSSVKGHTRRKKSKGKGVDSSSKNEDNKDVANASRDWDDSVEMDIKSSSSIDTVEGLGGKDPSPSVIRREEVQVNQGGTAQAGPLMSPCKPRRGRPPRHEVVPGTGEFTVFL